MIDRICFERWLTTRLSRRRLLAATGLAAAISLPGQPTRPAHGAPPRTRPLAQPAFSADPFSLGIASGDPLPDRVVLWTRLAPDPLSGGGLDATPIEVGWELADDESFTEIVQAGRTIAMPELAHSVHVDAPGLLPGRDYFYRFVAGEAVSPIGRTKTAPATQATVDQMRLVIASCQYYEDGFYTAYRFIAEEAPDLIVHLGDYIYEYGPAAVDETDKPRRHLGDETMTLTDYRNRYALYKTDPDLQAAHVAAPWIVTWDDHEVDNDYASADAVGDVPEDRFLERRAAAYQAYYEHMPLRPESMPVGPSMQLYRTQSYGALAAFVVLDTRQYRTDQPDAENPTGSPAATMLGPQQEQWLLANLDASEAQWNIIAQSIQMSEVRRPDSDVPYESNDTWSGYPAARDRILTHLMTEEIRNPIVLAGDVHTSWVSELKADWDDPDSTTIATEFIGTSITSGGDDPDTDVEEYLPDNPHITFFDPRHGGYISCTVSQSQWRSDFKVLDSITTEDAPIATIASFVVEDGRPGAVPA